MKKGGKRYYQKLFRVYPDLVTMVQFREMLFLMIDLHLSAFAPRWRFLYVVRIDAYKLRIFLPQF